MDVAQRPVADLSGAMERLARGASLELGVFERDQVDAAREFLEPGQRVYVSHLPRQTWSETFEACAALSKAGCDPIPHIPVRLLDDQWQLVEVLRRASDAGVREPLLLAGDYPKAKGSFAQVLDALRSGVVLAQGFTRVSFAGHPEGHPAVAARDIWQAQVDKWRLAREQGLEVSFVTQFFFAADPFFQWACKLRSAGVDARLVAGLAGPADIPKLLRLAKRCGVGPSLRLLSTRGSALLNLLTDHDPGALMRELAAEGQRCAGLFDGVHLFSFGGFARTASWLRGRSA